LKFLDYYSKSDLLERYRHAYKRLILLDYDGTLIPFFSNPSDAAPGSNLIELLKKLNNNKNDLWLVSGRSYLWFDKWFENLNINIIAEHGACIKPAGKEWEKALVSNNSWKEDVKGIMELYVRKCQYTFIEEKEYSTVWHYRNANYEQVKFPVQELYATLNNYACTKNLQVFMGNKIVEIKNSGIDKGSAIKKLLERHCYDFVLGIGDDYTDEDMFKVLGEKPYSFSIKVGNDDSIARFNLYTPQMVISLLEAISYIS
jgi:trehalose 6-phosphate synthase/phosphatase